MKCEEAQRAREAKERERLAKAKEEQRRADQARGARVEETRAEAERRRAADCATQGACPSSPNDVRDQLNESRR
jgi:cytosine/adenosine deaminase-related metal-dependent hydrolase